MLPTKAAGATPTPTDVGLGQTRRARWLLVLAVWGGVGQSGGVAPLSAQFSACSLFLSMGVGLFIHVLMSSCYARAPGPKLSRELCGACPVASVTRRS
jgi:hypothetical protein